MKKTLSSVNILLVVILFISELTAQDVVIPGVIRVDATFENISINYSIANDDNRNSNLILRYREAGAANFEDGAITMRAFPGLVIDGNSTTRNFHAGSLMFLNPGTTYEVELDLSDPDGGGVITSNLLQRNQYHSLLQHQTYAMSLLEMAEAMVLKLRLSRFTGSS